MPRIAAALSVFAAAAFCIGFNIVRYPIVWEKLAICENVAHPADLEQPAPAENAGQRLAHTSSGDSSRQGNGSAKPEHVVASISGGTGDDLFEPSREETARQQPLGETWPSGPAKDGTRSGHFASNVGRPADDEGDEYNSRDDAYEYDSYGFGFSNDDEPGADEAGLVPIAEAHTSASHTWVEPQPAAADGLNAHAAVRRLPPVDDWQPCPNANDRSLSAGSSRSYPSTGEER